MKQTAQESWPINQLLIFSTMLSLIIVILKFASDLIVPLLISIALAIVLSPLLSYLGKKHIPRVLSILFIIAVVLLPAIIVGGYIGEEVKDFSSNYQEINQQFNESIAKFTHFINGFGFEVKQSDINKILEKNNLGGIVKNLVSQAGTQFSNIFLIFFTVVFMLVESGFFYNKLIKICRENGHDIKEWMHIIEKIKSYFLIKVKTSLVTALWVLAVLWYYDISYFYLWASLAFFFNFIPVIGSILAAIPAIAMALIGQNLITALWVTVWYLIINTIVGNILEPKIMGKGLGLSALVIFLSMTFWGWVFGPAGMILSVPLTMVTQFLFSQYDETKWIALLLSDYEGKGVEAA